MMTSEDIIEVYVGSICYQYLAVLFEFQWKVSDTPSLWKCAYRIIYYSLRVPVQLT